MSLRSGMKRRRSTGGYTLIEMAMAITVLGMLTGMLLTMMTGQHEVEALKAEKKHLKILDEALAYHVKLRGRLPCPADPTLPETDINFGRENCALATVAGASANENIYFGMAPTRSLALADRHLYDAWGNRTGYAVIAPLTTDAASFGAYTTSESTGVIRITDAANNPTTQQLPDYVVAYALISYGKDKKGGYNRVGQMTVPCTAGSLDSANCDNADNILVDAEIADTRFAATYYHDLLRWRDLAQLRAAVTQIGAPPQYAFVVDQGNNRVQIFDIYGVYQGEIGAAGTGNGQFDSPTDVTVDASGNIYVVDSGNDRVQVFNSDYVYAGQFGGSGAGNGFFNWPEGIAIDSGGNIFVVDRMNHRVQKFDSNYNYLSKFGTLGTGNAQFNQPESIAIDSAGNMYITDSNNDRVQKIDASYVYVAEVGGTGNGNGQFDDPDNIIIDGNGNIYVTDSGNDRVQKFDSDLNYISEFGSTGATDGLLSGPTGIAVTNDGNTWVSDYSNNRVQVFSGAGAFLLNFGTNGTGSTQFNAPEGIAIR